MRSVEFWLKFGILCGNHEKSETFNQCSTKVRQRTLCRGRKQRLDAWNTYVVGRTGGRTLDSIAMCYHHWFNEVLLPLPSVSLANTQFHTMYKLARIFCASLVRVLMMLCHFVFYLFRHWLSVLRLDFARARSLAHWFGSLHDCGQKVFMCQKHTMPSLT